MSHRLMLTASAFALLIAGCTSPIVTRTVVTASSDIGVTRQPDVVTPAELESVLLEFGECVESSFPIAIRFRLDHFVALETEVGSLLMEEGDEVDRVYAECSAESDLDRRISVYQQRNPLSPEGNRTIASEFVKCVGRVSSRAADSVADAGITSYNSAEAYVASLGPVGGGFSSDELIAISQCRSAMLGAEVVFDEGHPWFTR